MAASSYYKLDNIPASMQAAQPYSGYGYDDPPPAKPSLHQIQTNNLNDPPSHAMEPFSKPLVTSTYAAVSPPSRISTPSNRVRMQKYQNMQRYLRVGRFVTKVITVLFSSIIFAIMVFMTMKYQTTKGEIRDGRNAWPRNAKLWPTFMLLAASGFTLMFPLGALLMYCCCFNKARTSWKLTVVKYVIHILGWIIVSALYRYEKSLRGDSNDLWGWTCSAEVDALQSAFNGVVKFDSLCSVQVNRVRILPRATLTSASQVHGMSLYWRLASRSYSRLDIS